MKITTKSRYAIRAIFSLIMLGGDNSPVALTNIAENESISRKYLEQIFIQLKKHNIVTGSRGAGGGYVLARAPRDILVLDVIKAMDGPITPVDCTEDEACDKYHSCAVNWLWIGLKKHVEKYFENITIEDLRNHTKGEKNADLP